MTKTLLEVRQLDIKYAGSSGGPNALRGVEFILEAGETLGVVGASGAGKSTLGLAVAGLLDPNVASVSGSVCFEGQNLLALSETDRSRYRGSRIAMIFQDPVASLDPSQRVVDQVAEAFRLHDHADRNNARELARQQLADVGIMPETLASAPYAHQLSGGQCQRVMIAAALAGKPDLLVADEPTSSLDVILQSRIIKLIKDEKRRKGMALIFISHDLPLVSMIADNILVLSEGQAVEYGRCNQVLTKPRHEFTAKMIRAGLTATPLGGSDAATA